MIKFCCCCIWSFSFDYFLYFPLVFFEKSLSRFASSFGIPALPMPSSRFVPVKCGVEIFVSGLGAVSAFSELGVEKG